MVTTLKLRYGEQADVALDLGDGALVAECGIPSAEPIDDPAAAVAAALLDPMEYPPLADCLVPGDQVAIAVDVALPQAAALVAGVVSTLIESGIESHRIAIVQTPEDARHGTDPRAALPQSIASDIELVTHNPSDRDGLSYLAASVDGNPIYVNRRLAEADVVIPIGCLRLESSLGYRGIYSGICPTFSDADTQKRFCSSSNEDQPAHRERRRRETEEAGGLLGAALTVQIVPGSGDSILHVLAGSVTAVANRGGELCRAVWDCQVQQRADLVVAAIQGGAASQTWDNLARALTAAMSTVSDGGAIALCTELSDRPGRALRWLTESDDYETTMRSVRKERSPDAIAAAQLLRALDGNRVYLLSRLDDEVVAQLGVTPIEEAEDLTRLSSRSQSCIVLANAQFAVPTVG
jgi:nickel-dependent lactate racemase